MLTLLVTVTERYIADGDIAYGSSSYIARVSSKKRIFDTFEKQSKEKPRDPEVLKYLKGIAYRASQGERFSEAEKSYVPNTYLYVTVAKLLPGEHFIRLNENKSKHFEHSESRWV